MTQVDRQARVEAALERRLAAVQDTIKPQPAMDTPPLSHVQESLWILSRLAGSSPVNNRPIKLRLKGRLQIDGLEWSLSRILQRHSVLRSVFPLEDGTPRQVITDSFQVRLPPVADASSGANPTGDAIELVRQHTRRRFDLTNEIPFRPLLVKIGHDDHVLAIASHHIVFDGWSEQILISELAQLYDTWCEGQPVDPLPPLPVQFSEFARWERSHVADERLTDQLDFWKRNMADLPPDLELPGDRRIEERLDQPIELDLDSDLRTRLQLLARGHGATEFMVMLAALSVLVSRHSGQDDFVVAAPTAGRRWSETEPLIGCFINTVLLRLSVPDNPTFTELVAAVRAVVLEALDHQEVPYSQVLGAIRPWASGDHTPLYRVFFQLRNFPELPVPTRHLSIEDFDQVGAGSAYLSIRAWPHLQGLKLSFDADSSRYDRRTIERWAGHYQTLLESLLASPEVGVRDNVLLGSAELNLLKSFNTPGRIETDRPPLVTEALRSRATATPHAEAVLDGGTILTFADLDRMADDIASRLVARGVVRGARVVLFMERGADAIAAMYGVMRAGAVFVPIDPEATSAWLDSLVVDTEPALILTNRWLLAEAAHPRVVAVAVDDLLNEPPAIVPAEALDQTDLAYVLFTSGSTGRPKGVEVEHRHLATFVANSSAQRRIGPGHRVILFHSLSFDGCFDSIFVPLTLGAAVVVRDRSALASIPRFLAWCRSHRISHMDIPTGFFNVLATEVLDQNLDFPEEVLLISIGGEQGRADLVVRWQQRFGHQIRFANDYGPTETTVWVSTKEVAPDLDSMQWLSVGKASPGCPIYVVDRRGQLSPVGVPGEVLIGGEQVARGYLNRPDLTADRFVPDPHSSRPDARMYRTGDLGRWLPNGDLELLGRIDRQVKIRGYRVELGEVESALHRLPGVADCSLTVRRDPADEPALVAYVRMTVGHVFDGPDLLHLLGAVVPPFMLPMALLEVSDLPRNLAGKVDTSQLPSPSPLRVEAAPPSTAASPIEQLLVEIWSEVLQRDIDLHASFFELGGHSLLAIRVMSRIEARLGVDLPLSVLFSHPTVALMATAIAEQLASASGSDLDDLLDELETMSDEDATTLLAQFGQREVGPS